MLSGSILNENINAKDIIKEFDKTNIDYIHLDIMDGKVTEKKTWTFNEIKKITSLTIKKLDVHLMTDNPLKYIKDYAMLNTEYISFHIEIGNTEKIINEIKNYGIKVGISINPDTDIEKIYPYLKDIDLVLIMSVVPGKSGQSFKEEILDKISKLKENIEKLELKTIISVDGGINNENAPKVIEAGANMLVSASFLHKDFKNNVKILKDLF